MTHIPFEAAGVLLYEYGFNIFPLRPRSKEAFLPWKQYQTEKVTEEQVDKWAEESPNYNWAVVCGAISDLVVFDCDDASAVEWARGHLPHTPFMVQTGHGWHLYYRYPYGREEWLRKLNPRKQWGIKADVQRDGKYVVAPGSIHPSGAVYELRENVDWSLVPEFTVFEDGQGETAIDVDLSDARVTAGVVPKGERNNALASFVGSLAHMRPRLDDREILRQAWDWNVANCKPPIEQGEFERTTRSIIEKDKREHPDAITSTQATNMEGLQFLNTEDLDIPAPDVLLNPPGILGEIQRYTLESTVRTTPVFAAVGALATIATLVGQKVQTETGLTTNVMLVCVGSSSSGKDAPKSVVSDLLDRVSPGYKGGNDVASDAALINHLAREGCHRAMFIFDEIGMLLKACKNPNSPKAGLVKVLTELFSKTSGSYTKVYAKEENNKTIPWHSLCVLGLSVPGEFFGALHEGEATNGFLARLLVFIDPGKERRKKKFRLNRKIPDELLETLKWLATLRVEEIPVTENKDGTHSLSFVPEPITCTLSAEAEVFLLQKNEEYDELQARYEEEGKAAAASIAGRATEYALKLALVFLVARVLYRLVEDHVITLEDMKHAWEVVDWCVAMLIKQLEYAIASNEFEALCQSIKKAIVRHVKASIRKAKTPNAKSAVLPGAPITIISKATPGVPNDVLKRALDKMIQSNELRLLEGWKSSEKSTRALDLYCIVEEVDASAME